MTKHPFLAALLVALLSTAAFAQQTPYIIDYGPSGGYPFKVSKGTFFEAGASITDLLAAIKADADTKPCPGICPPIFIQFVNGDVTLSIGTQTAEFPILSSGIGSFSAVLSGKITSNNSSSTIKIPESIGINTSADIVNTGSGYAIDNSGRFTISGSPVITGGIKISTASRIEVSADFTPGTKTYSITLGGDVSADREVVTNGAEFAENFTLTNPGWELEANGNNLVTKAIQGTSSSSSATPPSSSSSATPSSSSSATPSSSSSATPSSSSSVPCGLACPPPPPSSSSSRTLSSSSSRISSSSSTATPSSSSAEPPSSSSANNASSSSSEGNTPIRLPQIATANQATQIYNGVNLQTTNGAVIEIYSLSGDLINKQKLGSGIYTVSFGHLPKGLYIVRILFGSEKQTLRLPVR